MFSPPCRSWAPKRGVLEMSRFVVRSRWCKRRVQAVGSGNSSARTRPPDLGRISPAGTRKPTADRPRRNDGLRAWCLPELLGDHRRLRRLRRDRRTGNLPAGSALLRPIRSSGHSPRDGSPHLRKEQSNPCQAVSKGRATSWTVLFKQCLFPVRPWVSGG